MKTQKIKNFLFFTSILILLPFYTKSQESCLEPKYEDNCSSLLSSIFDDYIYLRSRAFSSKEDVKVEFEVTLKRNILYIFNVCDQGKAGMILNLYDRNDKLIATSINPKTKKNDKIITFSPDAAGRYYISTFFEKKDTGCCLIMFGMIRKNINEYTQVGKQR